ncbi:hypothetical protein H5410_046324 [Solanum commersonii]|uniref:Uncharacterized protein n=1 Tax=Solanum commersonii TaxID=4109 RepID=A0A9J5XDW3_SOLCO|nr:hypothetical protein H5410_046324 [Solanum commersonii]
MWLDHQYIPFEFQHMIGLGGLKSQGKAQALTGSLSTSVPQYSVLGGPSSSEGTPQVSVVLGVVGYTQRRVGLTGPHLGSSSISNYLLGFLRLAKHNLTLFLLDQELSHGLIRGLALPLQLVSKHLILIGSTFPLVASHVRVVESTFLETYINGSERLPST